MANKRNLIRLGLGIAVIGLVVIALFLAYRYKSNSSKLTFALPVSDWWTASPFIVPQSGGFFKQRGVELSTLEVNSGLASKNAVVAGTADVGLCAATPLALAAAKGEKIVILGTYLRSSAVVGLIRPNNMPANARPPEPVAIVPSTISESYLFQYLKHRGQQQLMEKKQLQQLNLRPADVPGALQSSSAKSAVIWEPFLSLGAERSGLIADPNAVSFEVNLYLITRPSVLRDNPDKIKAFLNAIEDSCRYLRDNSEEARRHVERRFDFRSDFLSVSWPKVQYGVTFDRDRMKSEITREAETARALGYISEVPNVDYLFPATPPQ